MIWNCAWKRIGSFFCTTWHTIQTKLVCSEIIYCMLNCPAAPIWRYVNGWNQWSIIWKTDFIYDGIRQSYTHTMEAFWWEDFNQMRYSTFLCICAKIIGNLNNSSDQMDNKVNIFMLMTWLWKKWSYHANDDWEHVKQKKIMFFIDIAKSTHISSNWNN